MKKILLASSALVLVGGAAFAEVTLSGSAEMGIFGGSTEFDGNSLPGSVVATSDDDPQFFTDMDVDFNLSGETDGGIVFGANIDLDDATDGNNNLGNPDRDGDFAIFVSGDFGTFTMGDTDGAFDWAMTDTNFGMAGTLNDNEEHLGFQGMDILDGFYDGQIARYDYSFGDFAFGVSAEIDDDADSDDGIDDPMLGIGAKYGMDLGSGSVDLGAAYQGADDVYVAGLTVAASFGGFSGSVAYFAGEINGLDFRLNDDGTQYELTSINESGEDLQDIQYIGLSGGYTFDAITIGANYGSYELDNVDDLWGAGITASYDLGGGLELQAGYGYSEAENDGVKLEQDSYSFGVAMSF